MFSSSHVKKCRLMCAFIKNEYGECPKISNNKVSDKMTYANSADPDQTAPPKEQLIRVYTVCHSTKYDRILRNNSC